MRSIPLLLALLAVACDDDKPGDDTGEPIDDTPVDADGDGFSVDDDCDDDNADINPDATEVCDELDNDCSGAIDDDATDASEWVVDADGDGFGETGGATVAACSPVAGYVADGGDCDDGDEDVYPGATESCDGADNNCNDQVDEPSAVDATTWYADADGDGFGARGAKPIVSCSDPGGASEVNTDCNDSSPDVHPGAEDTWYDGVDSNCDGASDWDADSDGFDSDLRDGGTDCDDADATVNPDATDSWYDGVDSDCDGADDYDADGDGYDSDAHGGDDCDDADAAINPGAREIDDDGVDSDCDGEDSAAADLDEDGWMSSVDCDDADSSVHPYAWEDVGDGIDNDCDGLIDGDDVDVDTAYDIGDDDYDMHALGSGSVWFCDTEFTELYVNSNGMVTFDDYYDVSFIESESSFYSDGLAIGAFWDDLNPSSTGEIHVVEYGDAVGVYWIGVPEYGASTSNTFSAVMYDDGSLSLSYDGMAAYDGLVGWSCADSTTVIEDDISASVGAGYTAGSLGLGMGTETAYYEFFTSSSRFDLDETTVFFCANAGDDLDGDGWTDECGDPDDDDPAVTP